MDEVKGRELINYKHRNKFIPLFILQLFTVYLSLCSYFLFIPATDVMLQIYLKPSPIKLAKNVSKFHRVTIQLVVVIENDISVVNLHSKLHILRIE